MQIVSLLSIILVVCIFRRFLRIYKDNIELNCYVIKLNFKFQMLIIKTPEQLSRFRVLVRVSVYKLTVDIWNFW